MFSPYSSGSPVTRLESSVDVRSPIGTARRTEKDRSVGPLAARPLGERDYAATIHYLDDAVFKNKLFRLRKNRLRVSVLDLEEQARFSLGTMV